MKITSKGLRDLFFLAVGTAILYQEFWQSQDPSPLGVFTSLFLFGLIPALRADESPAQGPLGLLMSVLVALGTKASQDTQVGQEAKEEPAAEEAEDQAAAQVGKEGKAGGGDRPSTSSPPESRESGSQ